MNEGPPEEKPNISTSPPAGLEYFPMLDTSGFHKEASMETYALSKTYSFSNLQVQQRKKPTCWTQNETDNFYDCIEVYGFNLRLFRTVLHPRTLRQLERKYHKERKRNPIRMEQAYEAYKTKKVHYGGQPNIMDKLLSPTEDSFLENQTGDGSDDSLDEIIALKLKNFSEILPSETNGSFEIMPLDYYLQDLQ